MNTHQEITEAFADLFAKISAGLKSIPNPNEKPENGSWSIREEFEHMVRSGRMVASALKQPKLILRSFGKPNRPLRDYDATFQRYEERLATLTADPKSPAFPREGGDEMEKLLIQWDEIGEKFAKRLQKWSEKDLDNYLLPHPLMGKILVREMLFFTHFHSLHHFGKILGRAEK